MALPRQTSKECVRSKTGAILILGLLIFVVDRAVAQQQSDVNLVHFSYATLLGSGVYQLEDRTVAILRIPFGWQIREPTKKKPGIRLAVPTAIGFHNFDFVSDILPDLDELGTISIVPGIELQYLLGERWRVTPGAYLGFGADFTNDEKSLIYGGRLSALYAMKRVYPEIHFGTGIILSGYEPENGDGDFINRVSAGFDAKFPTQWKFGDGNVFLGGHLIGFYYPDPVKVRTITGIPIEIDRELEIGVFIGARPKPKIFGISVDRLGVGYRFGPDSDAIVFFAGFPF